jgi:hypothetical protein
MMQIAIVKIPLIPIRIAPSEKSEMTDQLLFGDSFHILEEKADWLYINTSPNNYKGWINSPKNYKLIPETAYQTLHKKKHICTQPLTTIESITQNSYLTVPGGSCLYNYDKQEKSAKIADEQYMIHGVIDEEQELTRTFITETALPYLNAPYVWGGKTILGIDCSGLTQIIYRMAGVEIPRDSSEQVQKGTTVNFLAEAKPGDLAFFDNAEGIITHVGILLENNKIIHASGRVRIDPIDHQGIFNQEQNKYTHKLRVIKNMID